MHAGHDKMYYVRQGKGTFTVADETMVANPGDVIWAPADTIHHVTNTGSESIDYVDYYGTGTTMITLSHLFMQVDRMFRSRSDASRWRVTDTNDQIEVYRRPILTNEVTLGALGIGAAAMPVPQLVCTIALSTTQPGDVDIFVINEKNTPQLRASIAPHQLLAHITPIIAPFA
jgi:hypothetical protein